MSTFSSTENRVLMAQARKSLKGKWGLAVVMSVIYLLIMIAIQVTQK